MVAVSFISGTTREKTTPFCKSLTNFYHVLLYQEHLSIEDRVGQERTKDNRIFSGTYLFLAAEVCPSLKFLRKNTA
jgi:hypothetical protein